MAELPDSGQHPFGKLDPMQLPGLEAALEQTTAEMIQQALLGQPASMGRREVSQHAQVGVAAARRFWHAMGFPIATDSDVMFTQADLDALRRVASFVRQGEVDEELALSMTRALARTMDRLAQWQTQLATEHLMPPAPLLGLAEEDSELVPPQVSAAAANMLVQFADDFEPLLLYVWRRQLASAIVRMLADSPQAATPASVDKVVGFADLVSFTHIVQRLSERQLAKLVQRFELLTTDIVTTHGGRVVKTVGDELLFMHDDPVPAAAIALDIMEAMSQDSVLPDVRLGLARGPVVSRLGDIFGATVNRASRLTTAAPRRGIYVDGPLARALATQSGLYLRMERRRVLRGIGPVTPCSLHRARGRR